MPITATLCRRAITVVFNRVATVWRPDSARQSLQCRRLKNCSFPRSGGNRSWPKNVVFRVDAGFAKPEMHGVKYLIRTPANDSRVRDSAELLTRPVG